MRRSRERKKYSFEFKLHVVELYLSSEVSYQELAILQNINNYAMIAKWVNDFKIAGPDALRPKKKGRKKTLDSNKKGNITKPAADTNMVDTSIEYVKKLEDELLKLRIENAYLKELRRLRLELSLIHIFHINICSVRLSIYNISFCSKGIKNTLCKRQCMDDCKECF